MFRLILSVFFVATLWTGALSAQQQQDIVWVQIEAQPSLAQARERATAYASSLPDVNGFALGGGWYAIALGPYAPDDARQVLRTYRRDGQIPRDSYIAYTSAFRQQFWPIGANLLNLPEVAPAPTEQVEQTAEVETTQAETTEPTTTQDVAAAEPEVVEPQITEPDESPREARASEAELDRDARKKLQTALQWAGFYNAAIDGAFGRGTRNSMRAWQEANNHEPTGILTTMQRAELIAQYNAVLDGLGLRTVTDTGAGIEMLMPADVVSFDKYEPPFAHYESKGDIDARVLLLSQEGDQNTLYGLYDIMQTLEIVPETGPRERKGNSFTLIGESATMISHTEAWLRDGEIKGFTLIWPAGDEERRSRLLGEMVESFTRLDGALDPAAGSDEQSIDLVAGLEIRKPKMARSGFFLDSAGHIATTAEGVNACSRITINDSYEAEVMTADAASGVAILKPKQSLSPAMTATLAAREPRLQTDVAVAGFSYEGQLPAPTLTFGTLSDVKGLGGEPELNRLTLAALPGDAGGPVFDGSGAVFGMLLPAPTGTRKLPEGVSFAVDAEKVRMAAETAGLTLSSEGRAGRIAPEDLTTEAQALTVLVSCWE